MEFSSQTHPIEQSFLYELGLFNAVYFAHKTGVLSLAWVECSGNAQVAGFLEYSIQTGGGGGGVLWAQPLSQPCCLKWPVPPHGEDHIPKTICAPDAGGLQAGLGDGELDAGWGGGEWGRTCCDKGAAKGMPGAATTPGNQILHWAGQGSSDWHFSMKGRSCSFLHAKSSASLFFRPVVLCVTFPSLSWMPQLMASFSLGSFCGLGLLCLQSQVRKPLPQKVFARDQVSTTNKKDHQR